MKLHRLFFFLLLVFLPTQLGLHFWPEWTTVLGRRVDYLSPTIFLTDVLIFFLLASWVIEIRKKVFPRFHLKYVAFFIFIGVNIFVAKNRPEAIYQWIKVFEYVGLGWYIVKSKPNSNAVVLPLSIGVLYSSILAIAQFFLQHSLGFWMLGERTFSIDTPGIAQLNWGKLILRPYATFPHPNVLGGFLAVMIALIILEWHQTRRIVYCFIVAIAFVALGLTLSRSAWIIGAVGTIFVLTKIKRTNLALVLGVLFLVILSFAITIHPEEESIVVREQLNAAAISLWQTSPLLGVGLGNFLVDLPRFLPSRQIYFLQPVHNIYLLLLSETGVIGLGAFLWIVVRNLKKFKAPLCMLLILGFVDHYPLTLQQGQLLLTILLVLQ